MDNLEKVEKLRERAGVSYEEAKDALEQCNYDLLDAIVMLERQGRIEAPHTSSYTTTSENTQSHEFELAQRTYENDCQGISVGEIFNKFCKWCGRVFKKGCETSFNVTKQGKQIISIPVIALVLAIFLAFWLVLILLVVGLFCDFKYHFTGFESTSVDINDICDKASEACENIKNDFQGK